MGKREKEERQKREEDKLQKAAEEKNMTKAKESKKTDLEGQRKQLDKDKTRLEENQSRLEEEEKEMEEDEEDKRIEELEKRLELKKTEEAELILKEEEKLAAPMKIEEERKKIEEDAAESLQQIMAVKQQLQKADQVKSQPKPKLPTKVMVVNSNSFVPQKNTKHEIGVIKMGSPSQIRRAVKMEVKIEESETSSKSELGREPVGNYQITKVPTTSFELKKPQTLSEDEKKY